MTFAGDVAYDLETVGQPHLGNLAQRRIRLFRRRRVNAGANSPFLRACLEMARLLAVELGPPRLADQLTNSRHTRAPWVVVQIAPGEVPGSIRNPVPQSSP